VMSDFQSGQSNYTEVGASGLGTPPALVTLRAQFKNLDGNLATPDSPYLRITSMQSEPVTVDAIGSQLSEGRYTVIQDPVIPSIFSFSFIPHGLKEGLYKLEWGGKFQDGDGVFHTITISGQIAIGEINKVQDFINRVRDRLFDDHFVDYRLDEPVRQFPDRNIFQYIRDALSRINITGPINTNFDFNTLPGVLDELLVTGGVVFALYARARFEKANELNYSDGHTLSINRADFYKSLADSIQKDWLEAIVSYKKSNPPKPIGLKSQRMPFRVTRVIGLLPGYNTYFSQ